MSEDFTVQVRIVGEKSTIEALADDLRGSDVADVQSVAVVDDPGNYDFGLMEIAAVVGRTP